MQVKNKEKDKAVKGTEGFLHQSKVPLVPQNRSQPLGKSWGKTCSKANLSTGMKRLDTLKDAP